MPRECYFTGKRTTAGRQYAYSGQKISKGGFGRKTSGKTKRTFKPNIQTVTAVVDGRPARIKVSAKAIRNGLVVKPLKRKYGYTRLQKAAQDG
ncbi:MAG: 50S ribosomal protein L28 [Planctomycetota bacterium]|nr:MAG: 50S ribosomal protein L28 [Planctomycetota bacterium]